MSVLLNLTGTLITHAATKTAWGQAQKGLSDSESVRYNLQPDTSADMIAEAALRNKAAGKLYLPVSVTVNPETDVFRDIDGNEWEIRGLPVKSANSTAQWMPVERQLKR